MTTLDKNIDEILTVFANWDNPDEFDYHDSSWEQSRIAMIEQAKSRLTTLFSNLVEEIIGEFETSEHERRAFYIGRPDHQRDKLREEQHQRKLKILGEK